MTHAPTVLPELKGIRQSTTGPDWLVLSAPLEMASWRSISDRQVTLDEAAYLLNLNYSGDPGLCRDCYFRVAGSDLELVTEISLTPMDIRSIQTKARRYERTCERWRLAGDLCLTRLLQQRSLQSCPQA